MRESSETPSVGGPVVKGGPVSAVAHMALLVVVCGALFTLGGGSLPLVDPDESRCAVIVRDMIENGAWLAPHLDGEIYFDKPAPFFWLVAGAELLLGNVELAGRLIAAVAALAAVLIAYSMGRRLFSPVAGLIAGLVLATSGEFLYIARWYRMDMPFAACMWAAGWWFWRSEMSRHADGAPPRRKPWMGFYAFAALATLFKGPAGLALPVMVVIAYFLLSRQARRVRELFHWPAIGLYMLIAAPWYVAISIAQPQYAYEFFIRQNLLRFTTSEMGRTWPGVAYIPVLIVGLLPWTIYLPGAIIRHAPRRWRRRADNPGMLYIWLAAAVPFVLFSFSSTKLPGYILPVFLPLAVPIGGLIAAWIASTKPDALLRHGARGMIVAIIVMVGIAVGVEIYLGALDAWASLPIGLGAVAATWMIFCMRRDQRGWFMAIALAGVVGWFAYMIVHTAPIGYESMSTRGLAQVARQTVGDAEACTFGGKRYSFLLYTGMPDGGEFYPDVEQDVSTLAQKLASDRPVVCLVIRESNVELLCRATSAKLYQLGRERHRYLITNQPKGEPLEFPSCIEPATRPTTRPASQPTTRAER